MGSVHPAAALLIGGWLSGCLGSVTDGTPPHDLPASPPIVGSPVCQKPGEGPGVGLSSMKRLSRLEYERTVLAALGVPTEAIPPTLSDDVLRGTDFVSNTSPVSIDHARRLLTAARAVADAADIASLLSCEVAVGDRACAERFVAEVAPKLHRRPVTSAVLASYLSVFDEVAENHSFEFALRSVIEAMMMAPGFLYHVELGEAGTGTGRLTGPEIANRLSFTIWREPPDDALLRAAGVGELDEDEGLEHHARRLLADDRAIDGVHALLSAWLGIPTEDRDDLDRSAHLELRRFAEHLLRDGVPWSRIYDADYTWVDAPLAELYGVSRPTSGFERRALDPTERRGLLTSVAFLRASFHPNVAGDRYVIMQGKAIRERLLCEGLPPPVDLPPDAPRPEDYDTARAFSDALVEHPTCGGCHGLMDPIGRAFAHYDDQGRFSERNADGPVDATGEIRGAREAVLAGEFQGVPDLASRLSQSEHAAACFVRQVSRFALSRLDEPADGCSVAEAASDLGNGTLSDLIVTLVLSDAFRHVAAKESTEAETCGD